MGVPLPLTMPLPVVALPWSLVAEGQSPPVTKNVLGAKGAVYPGLLGPCCTGSSIPSSWAEATRAQRPLGLGMSHGKSPPAPRHFCHSLWVSPQWSC